MRHFELNSVSAGLENCGLAWARDQGAKLSAHLSNEKRNEPLDSITTIYYTKLWKFYGIVYHDFVTDLLWNNSVFIACEVIVTIAKFLWLIGGEKSAPN